MPLVPPYGSLSWAECGKMIFFYIFFLVGSKYGNIPDISFMGSKKVDEKQWHMAWRVAFHVA